MKIAIDVTPILPGGEGGGAKQLVLELIRGFAGRAAADQYVLLTSYKNHDVFQEFETLGISRIRVLEDPSVKQPSLLLRILNRLKSELNFYVLPGLLKKNDISVLFCPMTAPYYSEVGIPTVSIVYDLQHIYYPAFFSAEELKNRDYVYNQVKRKVDYVICISSYTRESVIEKLRIPPERVFSCPIAVHSRLNTPPREFTTQILKRFNLQGKKYVYFPANSWPHKNHKMLIVAFNIFSKIYPQYDLHLVLTGAQIESNEVIAHAIKQMHLNEKVHFLGYLPENELASIWDRSYALIFPSLFEGFGIPLVEAMMFNKPIITSNATSLPEVAGEAALYFNPKKPDEIVDCLVRLLEDSALYDSLVAKGQVQLKKFVFEKMIDEYLSVLHKATQQGPIVDFVEVSGVYGDGWAGPAIRISFNASKDDRLFKMRTFLPDWHPSLTCKISLVLSGCGSQKFTLTKEKALVIEEKLPETAGSWTIDISGGFIPGGSDPRTLTCMVEEMVIVDLETGENIYDIKG